MGGAGYCWRDLVPNDGIYRGISWIYRYGDMCLYGWLSALYNGEVSMLGGGGVDDLSVLEGWNTPGSGAWGNASLLLAVPHRNEISSPITSTSHCVDLPLLQEVFTSWWWPIRPKHVVANCNNFCYGFHFIANNKHSCDWLHFVIH
jgi:hypothetical protein